jgi:hypothetical protein
VRATADYAEVAIVPVVYLNTNVPAYAGM